MIHTTLIHKRSAKTAIQTTRQFCDRSVLMEDGHILKYFEAEDNVADKLFLPCVKDYDNWVRRQHDISDEDRGQKAAFEIDSLYHGNLRNLNLRVNAGECVVIQDMDNYAMEDILSLLEKPKARSGRIIVDGRPLTSVRDRKAAVIRELPAETMIFESMSYLVSSASKYLRIWPSSIRTERSQNCLVSSKCTDIYRKEISLLA